MFSVSTSILVGEGAIQRIGDELNVLKGRSGLLITSENLRSVGLKIVKNPLEQILSRIDSYYLKDREPTLGDIEACFESARGKGMMF
jgi:alcohol dehydrogenase class IV